MTFVLVHMNNVRQHLDCAHHSRGKKMSRVEYHGTCVITHESCTPALGLSSFLRLQKRVAVGLVLTMMTPKLVLIHCVRQLSSFALSCALSCRSISLDPLHDISTGTPASCVPSFGLYTFCSIQKSKQLFPYDIITPKLKVRMSRLRLSDCLLSCEKTGLVLTYLLPIKPKQVHINRV